MNKVVSIIVSQIISQKSLGFKIFESPLPNVGSIKAHFELEAYPYNIINLLFSIIQNKKAGETHRLRNTYSKGCLRKNISIIRLEDQRWPKERIADK